MADVATVKAVYLPAQYANAVAEALGIALLHAVDEEGRACPVPLCQTMAVADVRALNAILNMASIPNFAIFVIPDAALSSGVGVDIASVDTTE